MLAKSSSFLGPMSLFSMGGSSSLVLSLDAFGYTGSGTWSDLSNYNNHAVSDGYISWSPEVGGSFDFDGSSGRFVFNNPTGIPTGTQSYTIEVWFKSDSYDTLERGNIIGWGTYSNDSANAIRIFGNGLDNYWWFNDLNLSFSGTQSLIVDNWYYAAATFDGTNRKLYLNGNLVGSDVPANPHTVSVTSNLQIGYFFENYFNGKISKLKLYNKSLSAGRLLSNFESDKIRHGYVFGSMVFGGTNSYVTTTSTDYALGTDDFTIEGWIKPFTFSDYSGFISLRDY